MTFAATNADKNILARELIRTRLHSSGCVVTLKSVR